jgi:thiamine monophosphate synthase
MRLHCLVDDLESARVAADGATVIQLRIKGMPTLDLVGAGRPIGDLCRERGITFVVDDDVEAATACISAAATPAKSWRSPLG